MWKSDFLLFGMAVGSLGAVIYDNVDVNASENIFERNLDKRTCVHTCSKQCLEELCPKPETITVTATATASATTETCYVTVTASASTITIT